MRKKLLLNKDLLKYYYIDKKMSGGEIAKIFNCCPYSIYKYLREYNILVRSSEGAHSGSYNHNWKGGVSLDSAKKRLSMSKNKECPVYLGVYVAEKVLSKFFDNIIIMPYGNPGYDYICDKGYKIDVKSSCLHIHNREKYWLFCIDRNTIADYFLCLAFDDRESLKPQHIWLIPGNIVNCRLRFGIYNTLSSLSKWLIYEKPLDKVINYCVELKQDTSEVIV